MVTTYSTMGTPPERIELIDGAEAAPAGMIVLHSTRAGPAMGGCRVIAAGEAGLAADSIALAEAATVRHALAGLPFGGAQAILHLPIDSRARARALAAFGRVVDDMNGLFVPLPDAGMHPDELSAVISRHAPISAGAPLEASAATATGLCAAMRVAAARRLAKPLADCTVAIQGLGEVGRRLAALLAREGSRLIVADRRPGLGARVALRTGAELCAPSALIEARADIFAPCAPAQVMSHETARRLRASVLCGAAEWLPADDRVAERLAGNGVLLAPDTVVSAGGAIVWAGRRLGWSAETIARHVEQTGARLARVLDEADRTGSLPHHAAQHLAARTLAEQWPAAMPAAA